FLGGREARLSTFGLIELWVGLAALATIPLFERLPLIFVRLLQGFGDTFTVFLYLQIFLSALVMFVPTVLLGMTFPLVARLFTQSLYRVGSGVGSSYAANTVGAVLGAFAGGFILIPNIGVEYYPIRCGHESVDRLPACVGRSTNVHGAAICLGIGGVCAGGLDPVSSAALGSAYSHQRRHHLFRSLRRLANQFIAVGRNETGRRPLLS